MILELTLCRTCGAETMHLCRFCDEHCEMRVACKGSRDSSAEFDFAEHLRRQRDFSRAAFGPGPRMHGILDHISREIEEVRESGGALGEWIDLVILALDGALRTGADPSAIIEALVSKQVVNEQRDWPDWRTADPEKAIEHTKVAEPAPSVFEWADLSIGQLITYWHLTQSRRLKGKPAVTHRARIARVVLPSASARGQITIISLNNNGTPNAVLGVSDIQLDQIVSIEP